MVTYPPDPLPLKREGGVERERLRLSMILLLRENKKEGGAQNKASL
jgi:hypothetical protein